MGILKHLLFWPVTGPKALMDFSLRQVEGVAHQELTDDQRVKEDLMALQMELELGDIDEEEYAEREALLMERLREARAWRVRLGMEEEWKPLGSGLRRAESPADPATGDDGGDPSG
jgi:hypothetical protein